MQRVKHTNVDVRVHGQSRDDFFLAIARRVIEQYADPNAAISCQQYFTHQGPGTEPVMHDVVLHIDALLRIANQLGPRPERFTAVRQQAKPRTPRMRGSLGLNRAPERGVACGYCLTEVMGQARGGAASKQQREQHRGEDREHGQGLVLKLGGCSFDFGNEAHGNLHPSLK
ncbi:hypothetical protein D3C79_828360 [compost metagenome]